MYKRATRDALVLSARVPSRRERATEREGPKRTSTVSKAKTYDAIGAYWDSHEVPESESKRKPVEFEVDIRLRRYLVAIEPKLFAQVRRRAAKKGLTAEDRGDPRARKKCAASR